MAEVGNVFCWGNVSSTGDVEEDETNRGLAVLSVSSNFGKTYSLLEEYGLLPTNARDKLPSSVKKFVKQVEITGLSFTSSSYTALSSDGAVYTWGDGPQGELGSGKVQSSRDPVPVSKLDDKVITQVATGAHHVLALTDDGGVYAWGRGAEGQTGLGFKSTKAQALATNQGSVLSPHFVHGLLKVPIVRIAAGFSFSAAVARDGRVYTWGEGGLGQLGVGRMTQSAIPVLCLEKDEDGNGFVDIACGWGHTMALSRKGAVYAWGFNAKGQLGLGDTETRFTPQRIPPVAGLENHEETKTDKVTALPSARSKLSPRSQRGENSPRGNQVAEVAPPTHFVAAVISCGFHHSAALTEEGKLFTWGCNEDNRLGLDEVGDSKVVATPSLVKGTLSNRLISRISCGERDTVAFSPAVLTEISPMSGFDHGGNTIRLKGPGLNSISLWLRHQQKQTNEESLEEGEEDTMKPSLSSTFLDNLAKEAEKEMLGVWVRFTRPAVAPKPISPRDEDYDDDEDASPRQYDEGQPELIKYAAALRVDDEDNAIDCVAPGFPTPCDTIVELVVGHSLSDPDSLRVVRGMCRYSFFATPHISSVTPTVVAPEPGTIIKIGGEGLFGCMLSDSRAREHAEALVEFVHEAVRRRDAREKEKARVLAKSRRAGLNPAEAAEAVKKALAELDARERQLAAADEEEEEEGGEEEEVVEDAEVGSEGAPEETGSQAGSVAGSKAGSAAGSAAGSQGPSSKAGSTAGSQDGKSAAGAGSTAGEQQEAEGGEVAGSVGPQKSVASVHTSISRQGTGGIEEPPIVDYAQLENNPERVYHKVEAGGEEEPHEVSVRFAIVLNGRTVEMSEPVPAWYSAEYEEVLQERTLDEDDDDDDDDEFAVDKATYKSVYRAYVSCKLPELPLPMNLIRAAAEGKWNGDAVPNSVEGVQSIDSVMDYCYDDGMGFGDLPFRLHIRAEVSPNGVNFLPCKALIRTFVAELEKLSVNCGHVAGGTEVIVRGKGFVPSTEMRVRLRHNQQEWVVPASLVTPEAIRFVTPPLALETPPEPPAPEPEEAPAPAENEEGNDEETDAEGKEEDKEAETKEAPGEEENNEENQEGDNEQEQEVEPETPPAPTRRTGMVDLKVAISLDGKVFLEDERLIFRAFEGEWLDSRPACANLAGGTTITASTLTPSELEATAIEREGYHTPDEWKSGMAGEPEWLWPAEKLRVRVDVYNVVGAKRLDYTLDLPTHGSSAKASAQTSPRTQASAAEAEEKEEDAEENPHVPSDEDDRWWDPSRLKGRGCISTRLVGAKYDIETKTVSFKMPDFSHAMESFSQTVLHDMVLKAFCYLSVNGNEFLERPVLVNLYDLKNFSIIGIAPSRCKADAEITATGTGFTPADVNDVVMRLEKGEDTETPVRLDLQELLFNEEKTTIKAKLPGIKEGSDFGPGKYRVHISLDGQNFHTDDAHVSIRK